MGKRKSKAKVVVKKKPTVAKVFDCLFCDYPQSVEVTLKKDVGIIKCRNCNAGNEYPINALSKPIDVYCDWLDATRKVNLPQASDHAENDYDYEDDEVPAKRSKPNASPSSKHGYDDESDDE